MKTSFLLISGKTIDLELEPNEAFYEIKIKLANLMQVHPQSVKLLYKGQTIDDSKRIREIEISPNTSIKVVSYKGKSASQRTPKPTFENAIPEKPASTSSVKQSRNSAKHQQQLPPRSGPFCNSVDPPHFECLVNDLMAMGFEKEKCEQALRASFYNSDRAAEYLIDDNIPAEICSDVRKLQTQRDQLCLCDEQQKQAFLTKRIYQDFTPEEKESIRKLEEYQYDREIVIQVYLACDKDVALAASCLATMN